MTTGGNMSKIEVTYLENMGDDLDVVNAARVSFAKQSEYEKFKDEYNRTYYGLSNKDKGLLKYLATHNHFMPFTHCYLKFHVVAPLFVARQLMKHRVGLNWWDESDYDELSWSEESRRYVDDEPTFYQPDVWRQRAANVKQGSSDEPIGDPEVVQNNYDCAIEEAKSSYEHMLGFGNAPEQARMVLPQSAMVQWIWSGSLMAFIRVLKQRLDSHAQRECQEVARQIEPHVQRLYPESYKVFFPESIEV